MIQLDIRSRTKNPTPTPSVVRNPTPPKTSDSGSTILVIFTVHYGACQCQVSMPKIAWIITSALINTKNPIA